MVRCGLLPCLICLSQFTAAEPLVLEPIEFEAFDGSATVEVGSLEVPLRHNNNQSTRIRIEVAVFRRESSAPESFLPIVVLPGGPGYPGINRFIDNKYWYQDLVRPFLKYTDVIYLSQRGLGPSKPRLACEPAEHKAPSPIPLTHSIQHRSWKDAAKRCREKWSPKIELGAFNVIEAAGDVQTAVHALGYERVNLWGVSFGSHWAMTVMRYYPDIVARAVLAGLEGPDHTYDRPNGVYAAIDAMARVSEKYTEEKDLLERIQSRIKELDEQPATILSKGVDVTIDGNRLRAALRNLANRVNTDTWLEDMQTLARGDYRMLAEFYTRPSRRARFQPAAFFSFDCGSGISTSRRSDYLTDKSVQLIGEINRFYNTVCPEWGVDLGDEFRLGFKTAIPTLLVHGTFDVSTPYTNAQELQPLFKNGHLVTVEGGTHDALNEVLVKSPGFLDLVVGFLEEGKMDNFPDTLSATPKPWQRNKSASEG